MYVLLSFRSKLDLTVIVAKFVKNKVIAVKSTNSMAIWFVRINMHGASKHCLSLVIVRLILNDPKNCISFSGASMISFFRGTGGVLPLPPTGISVISPIVCMNKSPITHLMFGAIYSLTLGTHPYVACQKLNIYVYACNI